MPTVKTVLVRALLISLLVTATSVVSGCQFKSRPVADIETLHAERAAGVKRIQARKRHIYATLGLRVERLIEEAKSSGDRAVYDILILSGGGDYGAFGAGVLSGWGEISDSELTRPEFDFVTGVSTGALIAPYAFVGTDEAIETVLHMYSNPKDNWLKSRTLLNILTRQESFFNVKGLHEEVHAQMTQELAEAIADGVAEDRVLMAGATNLDHGVFAPFNLGEDFAAAAESGDRTRPVNIMLASSAIPGGFPPIEIDGGLYVDGGAAVQMFFPANRSLVYRDVSWMKEMFGDDNPKIRVWCIVNNKLSEPPKTIQPRLGGVIGRSLGISIRTSALLTLRDLETLALLYNTKGEEIEFRYLAVPEEFEDNPDGGFFNKDTMTRLGELGKEMGRDMSSWRIHLPSAEWPDEYFDGTGFLTLEQLRQTAAEELEQLEEEIKEEGG
jgi:hypothetical protein